MYGCFPNVEVSTFSSLFTAAPEPICDYWNLAVEYNALPWHRVCNTPNCCVFQPHISANKGGFAVCLWAKAPSLSPSLCKLKRRCRKAARRCQELAKCFQSAECIWAEMCLQTKNSIQFVIERVWTAWVNGHIWCKEEGFTSGNMEYPNWSHFLHWAAAKVPPLTYISTTQQV